MTGKMNEYRTGRMQEKKDEEYRTGRMQEMKDKEIQNMKNA